MTQMTVDGVLTLGSPVPLPPTISTHTSEVGNSLPMQEADWALEHYDLLKTNYIAKLSSHDKIRNKVLSENEDFYLQQS